MYCLNSCGRIKRTVISVKSAILNAGSVLLALRYTVCMVYSNGDGALSCVWCTVMAMVLCLVMVYSNGDGALSCVWCSVMAMVLCLVMVYSNGDGALSCYGVQ